MAFDINLLNLKPGTHGRAKPDVIAQQGKILWKCRICYTYNPLNVHACSECNFKNPMAIGEQQHARSL